VTDPREILASEIEEIPQHKQAQVSLVDQLNALYAIANRYGLYDAADFIAGPSTVMQRRPV
jgi:hypothetical protein